MSIILRPPDNIPDGHKWCPQCSAILPLNSFGICRARKDGLNLYCKACIRKKVQRSRRLLREFVRNKRERILRESAEREASYRLEEEAFQLSKQQRLRERESGRVPLTDRVLAAIDKGCHSFEDITVFAKTTRETGEDVLEAIRELLLDTRQIYTAYRRTTDGEVRCYFRAPVWLTQAPRRTPEFDSDSDRSAFIRFNMPVSRVSKGVRL